MKWWVSFFSFSCGDSQARGITNHAVLILTCAMSSLPYHASRSAAHDVGWSSYGVCPHNSIALVATLTASSVENCASECNQHISCGRFDMDLHSGQCRLFDADLTAGSIVANSLKPQSYVGFIQATSGGYFSIHDESLDTGAKSKRKRFDMA